MAIYDEAVGRVSVTPAVRANGTVNGAAVNLGTTGADSALVVILTGTITDGSHAVTVEESASGTGGWSAVPAGRLTGSPPTIVAANDDTQFEVGVQAAQPFLRVVVVTSGATTGGAFAAAVISGDVGAKPVTH